MQFGLREALLEGLDLPLEGERLLEVLGGGRLPLPVLEPLYLREDPGLLYITLYYNMPYYMLLCVIIL